MRLFLIVMLFLGLNSWILGQRLQTNMGNHYSAPKISSTYPITQMNPKTTVGKINAGSINVACVFSIGGLGDKSFNDMAYQGLQKAQTDGLVNTLEYELPSSTSDFESMLNSYASSATYDLIIAIGFAQKTALETVASTYTTQAFLLIDEIVTVGNVSSVVFKENEGSFLVGAMASLMTNTGKIGFIGGQDIPLIRKFWAGYKAGALYEKNRSYIEVIEDFVGLPGDPNAWGDPATAKAMAEAMWTQGVDIIYAAAGMSGNGVHESANEQGSGFYSIGVDADQDYLYPGRILTSMMKRVDIAVYNGIYDVYSGNWINDIKILGLNEDGVGISPMVYTKNIIGSEKIQEVNVTVRNKIISGELIVPNDSTSLDQWITDMGIITGPISISSNSDFSSLGFPGAGTSTNPYRIEGFSLIGGPSELIKIEGTTAHYQIKNNHLNGLENAIRGIWLINAPNGTIKDNNIIDNKDFGIRIDSSNYIVISNNKISNNPGHGIWAGGSDEITVENNIISFNDWDSINLLNSQNSVISNNTIHDSPSSGILFENSDHNIISHNLIFNHGSSGVRFVPWSGEINPQSEYNTVEFNDFLNNNLGATDDCSNNDFDQNYWSDWTGSGSYSISGSAGNRDLSPLKNPYHLSEPTITEPTSSTKILKDSVNIQWITSTDTFGHSITYSVFYSTDDGTTWNQITSGLTGTSYNWDLSGIFNGTEVLLKIAAEDSLGFLSVSVSDSTFLIENPELVSTTTTTTTKITPAWDIPLMLFSLCAILPLIRFRKKN
ncbi:MAG: BMP family ABC transporter substrate-binding protein [Candidatus Hodarchaeota archaeon]